MDAVADGPAATAVPDELSVAVESLFEKKQDLPEKSASEAAPVPANAGPIDVKKFM